MAQPPSGTTLPPTGSAITMSEINTFFGATATPIEMSFLGSYLGISIGATIQMSATFGGLLVDDYPA